MVVLERLHVDFRKFILIFLNYINSNQEIIFYIQNIAIRNETTICSKTIETFKWIFYHQGLLL